MKPALLSPLSPLARLTGLGLLSLLGYGWLAWRYPLAESLQWPRGGWYPPQEAVLSNLWVHLAVYGLLFGAYLLAIGTISPRRRGERRRNAEEFEEGKEGDSPAEAQSRGERGGKTENSELQIGRRIDTDGKDWHGGIPSTGSGDV
ncbi:MAG: hypothetical protein WAU10_17555, partial [Caldilineaceae bacterium]